MEPRTHNVSDQQPYHQVEGHRGQVFGLMDQLLLSGASFFTIIFLARTSEPTVVGQVALIVNVLTLFLLLHRAVWSAFTVFVAQSNQTAKLRLLREFLNLNTPIALLLFASMIVFSLAESSARRTSISVVALVVALISSSLLYECVRRVYWAFDDGGWAVVLSVLRTVAFLLGMYVLSGLAQKPNIILAMIWLISVRLVALPGLAEVYWRAKATVTGSFPKIIEKYWKFSKWVWLRSTLSYLAGNVYIPLLTGLAGFSAAGEFEVGRQIVAPFYIIPMGLASYLLPKLAQEFQHSPTGGFRKSIRALSRVWVAGSAGLAAVLCLLADSAFSAFLGADSPFGMLGSMIIPIAALGFAVSMNSLAELVTQAMNRPDLGWCPMAVSAAANAVIGIPMVVHFGVAGAFVGNALTASLAALLVFHRVNRELKTS